MLKYQNHWNCVENVWQFINARRLTCINIFYGLSPNEGDSGWGEGICMCAESGHLKSWSCRMANIKMRKVKQTSAAAAATPTSASQLLQLSQRIAQHLVVVFVAVLRLSWLPFCFESYKKECRLLLLLLFLFLLLLWPATCACFFCLSSLFLYFASARFKSHSKK